MQTNTFGSKLSIKTLTTAISLLGLGMATQVHGQNSTEEPSTALKKFVVNATRIATDEDETTRDVTVISESQLATQQPQSIAQTLQFAPNITAIGGPRPEQQGVNIRGLDGSKVLQVVDGVRLQFNSGHRPAYFLEPELLKSVEVVKGPVGSAWGSGAIGGVVSQTTVDAADLLKDDQNIGGFVKGSYNDNSDQRTLSGVLAGRSESVDWLINIYDRNRNDITLGNGERLADSANEKQGVLVKGEWQINDSHALAVNLRNATVEGAVPSNGTAALSSSNFLIERDQEDQLTALNYQFDPESDLIDTNIDIYQTTVTMDESRISDGRFDSTESEAHGIQISNIASFGDHTLLMGFDNYSEDYKASRSGDNRPTPPDATTEIFGVYTQANVSVSDDLALQLGARLDNFETKANNLGTASDDSKVSPSIALTWAASENTDITLRQDRAFRAPTSEELYTTGTHFCMGPNFCNVFVSNPDLEAETAVNNEIFVRSQFGNTRITASIFENQVDNFIEQLVEGISFRPPASAGTTTWRNVQDAEIKGFEISANYEANNIKALISYGQTRGEDAATGRALANIPADKISGDLSYSMANDTVTTGARFVMASSQARTPTEGTRFDGYTTADVYVNWKSDIGVDINLAVNNVGDEFYQQAFSELPSAGREIIISTRYNF